MNEIGNRLRPLRRGDPVAVVAPASACPRDALDRGLEVLRGWDLEPRVPTDLFGPPYIYANDDEVRWQHLHQALRDPDIRAVWAVRGGYGCTRLLPRLARARRRGVHRPVIGFSDITALHHGLNHWWGWPTWHGPVVAQLECARLSPASLAEVRRILFGEQVEIERGGLVPLNERAAEGETICGRLTGGNLKVAQSLLGTPWRPRWRDGIVVLEDVNERAYSVDRMLVQMTQAGALRGVRAMLFGRFTGAGESGGRDVLGEVLARFAQQAHFPVLRNLDIGHYSQARMLPLGMRCALRTGGEATLRVRWEIQ